MSDEQMQPLLKTWFRARKVAPTDVPNGVAQVMARMPYVRQRGRWWPLPAFRRKAKPPTTNHTTEYQSSPITTASNGHATTVIGRTQTMFSPVKAITAGALVFALGGVLFIAQPFSQQSNAPGAVTDDPGPAAYVQGFMEEGPSSYVDEVETYDDDGNRLTLRGSTLSGTMEMDDPRLSGALEMTVSIDEFPQPDTAQRVEVHWGDLTITNDQGGWSGTWKSTYDLDLAFYELTGAGAYEGLSALLAPTGSPVDATEFWRMPMGGAIFPGPLPPDSAYGE